MKIEYLQEYEEVVMQKCVNKPQQTVDHQNQCKQNQLGKSEDFKSNFVAKKPRTEESIDFINFSNNIGQVDHGRSHTKQQIVDHETNASKNSLKNQRILNQNLLLRNHEPKRVLIQLTISIISSDNLSKKKKMRLSWR